MKYFVLLFIISTLQSHSKGQKEINLSISNDGKFDILYHRFESTATGAILGGIIGGTIEEGVRKGKDTKKKKEILNLLSDATCRTRLIDTFIGKLSYNDIIVLEEDNIKKNKKSKFWLEINILKCGFKMVNSATKEVSAFVEFKTKIRNKNKTTLKKKLSIIAKNKYSYQNLVANTETLNNELTLVLIKAGQRLANKIIYQ